MPRIVSEYKEQARTRIIEQSLRVFSDRGYYQTKMADIAKAVGVSKAALYRYFDSREELFIEAMKHHIKARATAVRAFMNTGSFRSMTTPEFFDEMLKLSLSQFGLGIDLLRETRQNKALREALVEVSEDWGREFVDWIDEMKGSGEIRTDIDSSSISRGVIALRDGLYVHLMMGAQVEDVKKTWADMTGLLIGLAPRQVNRDK